MSRAVSVLLWVLLLWLLPLQASDDPYVGKFFGDLDGRHYRVSIGRVNSSTYDGILLVDDQPMQLDARRYGEHMSGLLRSHSEQFGFRARIEGGILIERLRPALRRVSIGVRCVVAFDLLHR